MHADPAQMVRRATCQDGEARWMSPTSMHVAADPGSPPISFPAAAGVVWVGGGDEAATADVANASLLDPHSCLCPALHAFDWHSFEQYRGAFGPSHPLHRLNLRLDPSGCPHEPHSMIIEIVFKIWARLKRTVADRPRSVSVFSHTF